MKRFLLFLTVSILCVALIGGCAKPAPSSPADSTTTSSTTAATITTTTTTASTTTTTSSTQEPAVNTLTIPDDGETLVEDRAYLLARRYNEIPKLSITNINGSVPVKFVPGFFSAYNDLGDISAPDIFLPYIWQPEDYRDVPMYADMEQIPQSADDLVYFKIPVQIVHDYVLQYFVEIDFSEGCSALYKDGQHYIFTDVGHSPGPDEYIIRNLQQTEQTATFLCDTVASYDIDGEVYNTQRFTLKYNGRHWVIYSVETIDNATA